MDANLGALIASSDPELGRILATVLGHCGLVPFRCSTIEETRTLLADQNIRLVFCEDRLADGDFRDALRVIIGSKLGSPTIVLSCQADWKLYSEAVQLGAFDCIGPLFGTREIEQLVDRALNNKPARQ